MILEKLFGFNHDTMKVRTEIVAGATTFLTMSYILAVNPAILSTYCQVKSDRWDALRLLFPAVKIWYL